MSKEDIETLLGARIDGLPFSEIRAKLDELEREVAERKRLARYSERARFYRRVEAECIGLFGVKLTALASDKLVREMATRL